MASVSVRSSLENGWPPARFGEALDEGVRLGVEVQEAHGPAAARACAMADARSGARARLDVENDRDAALPASRENGERRNQNGRRKVADRVVTRILEGRECHALAGTRHAADEEKVHADTR
jgi:hypothetical protein